MNRYEIHLVRMTRMYCLADQVSLGGTIHKPRVRMLVAAGCEIF